MDAVHRVSKVLVLCTGNSCRSQMAEGFLNALPGISAESAGVEPASVVHPLAIQAMQEVGIDISSQYPKDVKELLGHEFKFVITVCDHARNRCPIFPMPPFRSLHIPFQDPIHAAGSVDEQLAVYRTVRDQISAAMQEFASTMAAR
ncbi:arsenate reductase ArsC [soil metagenome]